MLQSREKHQTTSCRDLHFLLSPLVPQLSSSRRLITKLKGDPSSHSRDSLWASAICSVVIRYSIRSPVAPVPPHRLEKGGSEVVALAVFLTTVMLTHVIFIRLYAEELQRVPIGRPVSY